MRENECGSMRIRIHRPVLFTFFCFLFRSFWLQVYLKTLNFSKNRYRYRFLFNLLDLPFRYFSFYDIFLFDPDDFIRSGSGKKVLIWIWIWYNNNNKTIRQPLMMIVFIGRNGCPGMLTSPSLRVLPVLTPVPRSRRGQ